MISSKDFGGEDSIYLLLLDFVSQVLQSPIQEMSIKHIPTNVSERVESIAHESQKILKNLKYVKFAKK